MNAAEAAALADKLAENIRRQVSVFSVNHPELAKPFIERHISSTTAPYGSPEMFMPEELFDRVSRSLGRTNGNSLQFTGQDAATMSLWRRNRVVYNMDPTLWAELGDTDDDTTIPAGLFTQLPHPDPFFAFGTPMRLPIDDEGGYQVVGGFFVTGRAGETRVTLAQRSTMDPMATHIGLLIAGEIYTADGKPVTVVTGQNGETSHDTLFTRVTLPNGGGVGDMIAASMQRFTPVGNGDEWLEQVPMMVRRAIASLVYVCAANAELRPLPGPVNKRLLRDGTKKPVKLIEVGYRIGAALRAYRQPEQANPGTGTGRSKAPHVRRAHFHTYWTGPGRITPEIKWLSPIPINVTGDAEKTTIVKVPKKATR